MARVASVCVFIVGDSMHRLIIVHIKRPFRRQPRGGAPRSYRNISSRSSRHQQRSTRSRGIARSLIISGISGAGIGISRWRGGISASSSSAAQPTRLASRNHAAVGIIAHHRLISLSSRCGVSSLALLAYFVSASSPVARVISPYLRRIGLSLVAVGVAVSRNS